ncbi:DUF2769 domain-containing protein [Vulgatibacter incomptus]|uniref:DUF2769 domain-containing protein n=1 Tax=Vulgatibacter incomptus TaxID=1391653 RepID=A0A0K1PE06_9BACT|nr:DUF2769 domain-containing protein [Vulgatibacter incomptus]AKU91768.1 hypothetical protein AKJ08_2155 [Vulgatibacter incomptus]
MAKVEFTLENIKRCQCGSCPVYLSSACAKGKNASIDWSSGKLPPAKVIEGIYCAEAVGKSRCDDLDSTLSCNCPTCPVWEECGLNETHYCIRGAAK